MVPQGSLDFYHVTLGETELPESPGEEMASPNAGLALNSQGWLLGDPGVRRVTLSSHPPPPVWTWIVSRWGQAGGLDGSLPPLSGTWLWMGAAGRAERCSAPPKGQHRWAAVVVQPGGNPSHTHCRSHVTRWAPGPIVTIWRATGKCHYHLALSARNR